MQIFYTTSAGFDLDQPKPSLSLGGYKSSTTVKNDDFSNVFDMITPYTINQNRTEYIALMLQNTDGTDYATVDFWITDPTDSYTYMKIGLVTPAQDSEGFDYIGKTRDKYDRPMSITFVTADVSSKIQITNFLQGDQIGIWLSRELNVDYILEDQSNFYEVNPTDPNTYIKTEKETSERYILNIEYT